MSMQESSSQGGAAELATRTAFRVWIDQDLCTGDGLCVDVVRENGAALNDPGMAESQAAVPQEHEKAVVRAALICPGECIFIENERLA
jgi:ferredoxin